jgi:hypothetical protein
MMQCLVLLDDILEAADTAKPQIVAGIRALVVEPGTGKLHSIALINISEPCMTECPIPCLRLGPSKTWLEGNHPAPALFLYSTPTWRRNLTKTNQSRNV